MAYRARKRTLAAIAGALAHRAGAISVAVGLMCLVALAFIMDERAGVAALAVGLIIMGIDWRGPGKAK